MASRLKIIGSRPRHAGSTYECEGEQKLPDSAKEGALDRVMVYLPVMTPMKFSSKKSAGSGGLSERRFDM